MKIETLKKIIISELANKLIEMSLNSGNKITKISLQIVLSLTEKYPKIKYAISFFYKKNNKANQKTINL